MVEDVPWDFSKEDINIYDEVIWLSNQSKLQPNHEILKNWPKEGKQTYSIDKTFCDPQIQTDVFKAKDIFDGPTQETLSKARGRANLFETIHSAFFMNRAALKMANIDAATGFLFTNIDQNDEERPIYFADVCAGPGGFTEYILWRKEWMYKGFGFTLKNNNNFRLGDSICACSVTFQALYGKKGDGNVCNPENITDFVERVRHESNGVHFLMSDAGFSVEGHEEIQEILSKNIYVCQCFVALSALRAQGHFVTKLFDVFTSFSVGLLFLMYLCFEKVCIIKPKASRPANSERYFVCYNLRNTPITKIIKEYLWSIVNRLWEIKDNDNIDVLELVPLHILKEDEMFFSYIQNSNNRIGQNQIFALQKLLYFCKHPNIEDLRQEELRKKCLEYWNIPDIPRRLYKQWESDILLETLKSFLEDSFKEPALNIHNKGVMHSVLTDVDDWSYAFMHNAEITQMANFYACVGKSKVYKFQDDEWIRVKNIQLVPGTLLYGELVTETIQTERNQDQARYSLHIIDALHLGTKDVSGMDFSERSKLIAIFCKSINKESQVKRTVRIRHKVIEPLRQFPSYFNKSTEMNLHVNLPVLGFKIISESFEVTSLLILKSDKNQSFYSSYISRAFLQIQRDELVYTEQNLLQELYEFIKDKYKT